MKILNLTAQKKTLRALVYGKPGSGKTTFVGSAALDKRTTPVLHIDYSGNPESIEAQQQLPDVIRLQELSELNAVYDWFFNGQPTKHPMVEKGGLTPGYKTLVFDGVTGMQRRSFNLMLGVDRYKPGDQQPLADWTHYRSVLAQMIAIASAFYQTLPDVHILMTALQHEETRYKVAGDKSMENAYIFSEPGLQGQAVTELPGEALLVMRFAHKSQVDLSLANQLKAKYTVAQLLPSMYADAKDQYNLGTQYLADPTVTTILDRIEARSKKVVE